MTSNQQVLIYTTYIKNTDKK